MEDFEFCLLSTIPQTYRYQFFFSSTECDSGEAKVSLSYDEQPTSANSDVSASGLCTGGGLNVTLAGRASFMPSAIGFLVEPVNMSATLPNVTIDCGCELPSINVCSSDLPFGSASAGLIASPSLLSVQASADGDVDIPCKISKFPFIVYSVVCSP